jgi:hypothetical protein
MERRKLLVTGCGRSGTLYASEVWKSQGLDVRHENPIPPNGRMGKDGIASWYMAVNDPDPPFGPSAIGYEFDVTIHQVRYPLEVIASVAQFVLREPRSRNYIERNAPGPLLAPEELLMPGKQQLLLMASRYWHFWNLLAEAKATVTVQVENLTASLEWLCELLKVDYRPGVADSVSNTTNGRYLYTDGLYWVVSWDDLYRLDDKLCDKIKLLAETYGYST